MTDPTQPPLPWCVCLRDGDGGELDVNFYVRRRGTVYRATASVRGRDHYGETQDDHATAAVLRCMLDIFANHRDLRLWEFTPANAPTRDEAVAAFARETTARVLGIELSDEEPRTFLETELAILAERDAAANANRATVYAALHCLGVADCDDPYLALADAVLEVQPSYDRLNDDLNRVAMERDTARREADGLKAALAALGVKVDTAAVLADLARENEELRSAVGNGAALVQCGSSDGGGGHAER